MKICTKCHRELEISMFRLVRKTQLYTNWCKECLQLTVAKRKNEVISQILTVYGARCACCGEAEPKFLTIDHVNGGGEKHRKEIGRYRVLTEIIRAGFPSDYQILCWNCNCGKSRNGGVCPHKG